MRLLEIGTSGEISLTHNLHDDNTPYAILSYTWGLDHEEVTFNDLKNGTGRGKAGAIKIEFCGR